MIWSDEDKLREIEREITMRQKVYRRLVEQGGMQGEQAMRQIDIMVDVARDYRIKIRDHQPELFDEPKS